MFGNGNCDVDNEKTIITSSKWTQSEIDDHKVSMASSTGNRVMEKPGQELLQQQQQALRCPRCDSSNTKFCYYNNYSLTQPRHFCKACKRYWTRGGTLRNVPVGGGCRKNKRLKRPTYSCSNNNNIDSSASPSSSTPSSVVANPNPPSQSQQQQQQQQHHSFDIAATSNHINTMLYGGNSCHDVMNFPFSTRFNSTTRVSNPASGYDNLPQNGLGLGFSSGILMSAAGGEVNLNHHHHHHHDEGSYRNGFSTSNNNNYSSIFGSSSTSTTPVMASLLSSTLLQQKFMSTGGGIKGGGGGGGGDDDPFHHHQEMDSKEVKLGEGLQNRLDQWNMNNLNGNGGAVFQNQMENMGLSDNNASLYWNNNHNNSNNNTSATATGLSSVWSTDQPGSNSVSSLI
ncbi:dof zinc finger protein DOF1.4 [Lathyrus oleraceus]|uniref:Dof zinc finger protein n=2 Tax=Pisum sativum TaxID=3888 RepID=A0A9D4ZWQ0_PEA|nr:dof zinc finger protein DOF1.4-like [Pisum sativum]KAI5386664.1 hypothetical protein KIW84_072987 [Pisum sativum]